MEIIINTTVPASLRHDGKTGGKSRLIEILKRFGQIDKGLRIVINTSKCEADSLKNNGIDAEYRITESSLSFKNKFDLSLKSLYLTIKSLLILPIPFAKNSGEKIIVYASSDLFWETIPAFFYKTKNKKINWVQVIHHIYPDWKKRSGNKLVSFFGYYLQESSFFLIKRKADKIIVLNNFVKNELVKRGFDEKKIFLNSNGIDFEYINSFERKNSSREGVFLGRLSPSKGINDLIEIWKKVCESFPKARLAIVGGGSNEEKSQIIKKIKDCNLDKNIDFLGFLNDNEVFPILKSSKIFLFPSHEEGWGIAIAEAMACGLPVVSWNLSVYQEVFENYTIQVKENDVNLFSEKTVELLKNNELQMKIGNNGKEFIKKYSWDKVAKREYEIIKA